MSPVRVLVVDDHDLFRRGLVDLLAQAEDVEVVGEASNATEALAKAAALAPEVVFMDVQMPGLSGVEAVAALTQRHPEMKVLMLTVSEAPETLFQSLAAGARGYVLKTTSPAQILEAFRQVSQGWAVISPAMAPLLLEHLSQQGPEPPRPAPDEVDTSSTGLTRRETEVARLIARGYTNTDIAAELSVSEDTVKTHVRNTLGKLQMSSKREVVARVAELGLL